MVVRSQENIRIINAERKLLERIIEFLQRIVGRRLNREERNLVSFWWIRLFARHYRWYQYLKCLIP